MLVKPDKYLKRLLSYFEYEHLPDNLQQTSKKFYDLVSTLYETTENCNMEEFIRGVEKLLEAKDIFVRNKLMEEKQGDS